MAPAHVRANGRSYRRRELHPEGRRIVVCAVAGIDDAERPVAAARALAQQLGDELALVHVAVPPPPWPRGLGIPVDPLPPIDLTQSERAAASVLRSVAARFDLEGARSRPLVGDPATAVVDVAEELDADLIVVGSHRRGPLASLLLGSVSRRIADATDRPVVVVPTGEDLPRPGPVRSVVCGVDGSPESRRALRIARDLAARLAAELVLASAQVSLDEGRRLLRRIAGEENAPTDTVLRVGFGSPAEVLEHVAAEETGALIVVGRRGGLLRDLLRGSVSASLSAHTQRIVVLA